MVNSPLMMSVSVTISMWTVADDLAALSRLLGEGVRVEAVALVLAGAPSA
jgi:hypothetical protein